MNEHKKALAVIALALMLPLVAHAQVHKCVDAKTAKVTYTDGPCEPEAKSSLLVRRLSPEEAQAERDRAAEAKVRHDAQTQALVGGGAQAPVAQGGQESPAPQVAQPQAQPYAPAPSGLVDRSKSRDCQTAKRNLETAQSVKTMKRDTTPEKAAVELACGLSAR